MTEIEGKRVIGDLYAHCTKCGSKDTMLVDDIQKLLESREPPYKCNSCGNRFYATQFFKRKHGRTED